MTEFNENQFNLNDLIEYKEHPEKYSDEEMQEFINWLMNYTLKYGFERDSSEKETQDVEKRVQHWYGNHNDNTDSPYYDENKLHYFWTISKRSAAINEAW